MGDYALCQVAELLGKTIFRTVIITMEEVEAGFLEGPFKSSDLPEGAVVSPRFAIRQSNKTRPIDNFTSLGLNGTVGLANKLQSKG